MKTRALTLLACLVPLAWSPQALADEEAAVLVDFEQTEPADGWTIRDLTLSEVTVPQGKTASGGRALKITGEKRGARIYRPIQIKDWRRFRALSLYAKVEAAAPIEMRIVAIRGKGPASLLRRLRLPPGDWREIVLPLRDWREDLRDQVCDFSRIDHLLIRWDKSKGSVTIDDLRLVPGKRGNLSSEPTGAHLQAVLFPGAESRAFESKHFVVLTTVEAKQEDVKPVLERLERGRRLLQEHFGITQEAHGKATLFVAKTERAFGETFVRLGKHVGLTVDPAPTGNVRCLVGIGGSWLHPKYGWDRPTFTAGAIRSWMHGALGIAPNGNWITSGLSTAIQARMHPASLPKRVVWDAFERRGQGKPSHFRPMADVLAGRTVKTAVHPQAATVVEFLADQHRDVLPKIWEALRTLKGPVGPKALDVITKTLGTTLPEFEKAWIAWGRRYYAAG